MSHITRQRRYRAKQNALLAMAKGLTPGGGGLSSELLAERDRFVAMSPSEAQNTRGARIVEEYLGFTRAEWLEAGLPDNGCSMFDNSTYVDKPNGKGSVLVGRAEFHAPPVALLELCGMVKTVKRWRRELWAKGSVEGWWEEDAGPPEHWTDEREQWERDNPEIMARLEAAAEAWVTKQAAAKAAADEKDRLMAERKAKREANKAKKEVKAALAAAAAPSRDASQPAVNVT
jgi:hypothetical protein